MKELLILIILGICSVEDIRTYRIHSILPVIGQITGIIFFIREGDPSWYSLLAGWSIGLAMAIGCCMSHGKVGMGDSMVIMMTGACWGFWSNLFLLWISSLLTACVGFILIMTSRQREKQRCLDRRIPYIPVVTLVFLIMFLANGR